jgi:hypothetical protein
MTPRRPIGVQWGEGGFHRESSLTPSRPIGVQCGGRGFHRESSLLLIGRLRVIHDSQLYGYAIRIRVKFSFCSPSEHIFTNCIIAIGTENFKSLWSFSLIVFYMPEGLIRAHFWWHCPLKY